MNNVQRETSTCRHCSKSITLMPSSSSFSFNRWHHLYHGCWSVLCGDPGFYAEPVDPEPEPDDVEQEVCRNCDDPIYYRYNDFGFRVWQHRFGRRWSALCQQVVTYANPKSQPDDVNDVDDMRRRINEAVDLRFNEWRNNSANRRDVDFGRNIDERIMVDFFDAQAAIEEHWDQKQKKSPGSRVWVIGRHGLKALVYMWAYDVGKGRYVWSYIKPEDRDD